MARRALFALWLVGACTADALAGATAPGGEHHEFTEVWPDPGGTKNLVGYDLVCHPSGGCGLAAEGFMVGDAIPLRRSRSGRVSRFACDREVTHAFGVTCKPGDVLFELHERGRRQPITVWKTMQPLLPENMKPGIRFRRVRPGTPP
jgi:hypothetical protein